MSPPLCSAAHSYVDQGGGKRKGAFAIYMEPWHSDVFEFLDLRKNTGGFCAGVPHIHTCCSTYSTYHVV